MIQIVASAPMIVPRMYLLRAVIENSADRVAADCCAWTRPRVETISFLDLAEELRVAAPKSFLK
jgi:hypothetical protein